MRRYVLVSPLKSGAARVLDFIGAPLRLLRRRSGAPAQPTKITCLLLDHIGDVILATPALRLLRTSCPDARITIIVGPWSREVLSGNPDVDEVAEFAAPWFERDAAGRPPRGKRLSAMRALSALLRSQEPDVVLDFRGDFRHIAAMTLAKIPYPAGFGITGGGFLLSLEAPFPFELPAAARHLALVGGLARALGKPGLSTGLGAVSPETHPLIYEVSADTAAWAESWLAAHGIEGPFAVVHPGAGRPEKLWPQGNWREVVAGLTRTGLSVVVTGSPAERELAEYVAFGKMAAAGEAGGATGAAAGAGAAAAVAAGDASLAQSAALVRAAAVFVGQATGAMHLAAALGTPIVAIYDLSSDPAIWGPWTTKAHVLMAKRGLADNLTAGVEPRMVLEAVESATLVSRP